MWDIGAKQKHPLLTEVRSAAALRGGIIVHSTVSIAARKMLIGVGG
jgi:hypothetical protein